MPYGTQIAAALGGQLKADGWWPPNDLNKVLGKDYHYDNNTIALLLQRVSHQLANGTPPVGFVFDDAFAAAAVAMEVADLIAAIDGVATP
jgi:hypothetical protein